VAQTKRKRRSKHRGTAAGTIEARGRTGRKPEGSAKKAQPKTAQERRTERMNRAPTWRSAANRAVIAAVVLVIVSIFLLNQKPAAALGFGAFALLVYIPLGYYMDLALYRRRMKSQGKQPQGKG
jgi:Flp pilus assembly protein TadB